jgi:hypothetical protein
LRGALALSWEHFPVEPLEAKQIYPCGAPKGFRMQRIALAVALVGAFLVQAEARWKPEYASAPQEVQDWYHNAQLTAAAQRRFAFKSCCEHADVVKTQFRVNKATSGDEWYWLDGEDWRRVPDDIIHWGESAPGGRPTLFVYQDKETCFWPGDPGI